MGIKNGFNAKTVTINNEPVQSETIFHKRPRYFLIVAFTYNKKGLLQHYSINLDKLSFIVFFTIIVGLPCEDDSRFSRLCPDWKANCTGSSEYFMSKYCRKTCETCDGGKFFFYARLFLFNFLSRYIFKKIHNTLFKL